MKTKKTFLSIILLLSISLSSLLFLKKENNTKIQNYLLLNIEALAQNENYHRVECFGLGALDCPISNFKSAYISYR